MLPVINQNLVIGIKNELQRYYRIKISARRFFRQKKRKKRLVSGTEHEKFLFSLDDFKPIPYEGENELKSF